MRALQPRPAAVGRRRTPAARPPARPSRALPSPADAPAAPADAEDILPLSLQTPALHSHSALHAPGDKKVDFWRETNVRYLGYTNECGEAFAAFLPLWGVPASYVVAGAYRKNTSEEHALRRSSARQARAAAAAARGDGVGGGGAGGSLYVLCDTASKAMEANDAKGLRTAAVVGLDTLSWQVLASVLWPGSIIRAVVAAASFGVAHAPPLPPPEATLGVDLSLAFPTLVGLASIPFIVKPIDVAVDAAMEASVSKVLHGRVAGVGDAATAGVVFAGACALPPAFYELAHVISELSPAAAVVAQ